MRIITCCLVIACGISSCKQDRSNSNMQAVESEAVSIPGDEGDDKIGIYRAGRYEEHYLFFVCDPRKIRGTSANTNSLGAGQGKPIASTIECELLDAERFPIVAFKTHEEVREAFGQAIKRILESGEVEQFPKSEEIPREAWAMFAESPGSFGANEKIADLLNGKRLVEATAKRLESFMAQSQETLRRLTAQGEASSPVGTFSAPTEGSPMNQINNTISEMNKKIENLSRELDAARETLVEMDDAIKARTGSIAPEDFLALVNKVKNYVNEFIKLVINTGMMFPLDRATAPVESFILQQIYAQGLQESSLYSGGGNTSDSRCPDDGNDWVYIDPVKGVIRDGFCIFKFEASFYNQRATSKRNREFMNQVEAVKADTACKSLGAELPTTRHMQAIARKISQNPRNWGYPNTKFKDQAAQNTSTIETDSLIALSIGEGEVRSYHPFEMESAPWTQLKRVHHIADGNQVIWDIASNLAELVRIDLGKLKRFGLWYKMPSARMEALVASLDDWYLEEFGPEGRFVKDNRYGGGLGVFNWLSSQKREYMPIAFWGCNAGCNERDRGVFSMRLSTSSLNKTTLGAHEGFRCVIEPRPEEEVEKGT